MFSSLGGPIYSVEEDEIISYEKLAQMREQVLDFVKSLGYITEALDVIIDSFSNKPITQSFFASGNFGEAQNEKLIQIERSIIKYRDTINGSLVPETLNFIDSQMSRLNQGR